MLNRLNDTLRAGGIAAQMIRGLSGTSVLILFNFGATFITAIVLARLLGAAHYGIYAYAISWVTLLGVFAKFGIDQVLIREISVFRHKDDWSHIRGIFRFSLLLVGVAGLVCAAGSAVVALLLHGGEPEMRAALYIACLLLPLQALLAPFGATQQGMGQITYGQVPTLLVVPVGFLVAIEVVHVLAPGAFSAEQALQLRVLIVFAALLTAIALLRSGMVKAGRPAVPPKPAYQSRAWFASAASLVLMGSMFMVNSNADILMLGSMVGPEAAGVYKAATRGAELVTYGASIVSTPLGPIIARLHAAGMSARLQIEVLRWARIAFFPALLLGATLLIEGRIFLGLFGAEFSSSEAVTALTILVAGQLAHVVVGPVGLLLIMTGNERSAAKALFAGAIVNVILNAVLIPTWGIAGAAIATAAGTVLFAMCLTVFVFQKIGINPTVFSVRTKTN